MTVNAAILADSRNAYGDRLTTFEIYYPWFIHSELMTHRLFSRNAASSRAIPIAKFVEMVRADTAIPVRWARNGKGMQDHGVLSAEQEEIARAIWLEGRDLAIGQVGKFLKMKESPHKQIVNRMLMPYAHIRVVVSATNYTNFFALRRDEHADPNFHALADVMWEAFQASQPRLLQPGEWHLPYIMDHERAASEIAKDPEEAMRNLIKVSVARCARTSYRNNSDKVSTFGEDHALYENRLVGCVPMHATPAEHQATPDACSVVWDPEARKITRTFARPELHGNFTGFVQFRKTLPNEFITSYNPEA
jgi:hypothetical protein